MTQTVPRQCRHWALALGLLLAAPQAGAEKKVSIRIKHPPVLADALPETRVIFGQVTGKCAKEFVDLLAQDMGRYGVTVVAQPELDKAPAVRLSVDVSRCEARPREPLRGVGLPAPHISRTEGHFLATLRAIELSSGEELAMETVKADPFKENESQSTNPEYPNQAELIEMALRQAVVEARRLYAPWTESREISFMDDKDCNLRQAYELLKAGDYLATVKTSRENAEACRSNPRIAAAAWYNLGVACMLVRKYNDALSALGEAQKLRDSKAVSDMIGECRKSKESAEAAARRIAARAAQAQAASLPTTEVQTGILVTNELVIKLVRQDVAEDVITGLIASQPVRFSLGPDDLLKLQQAGVPDSIVAAMRARK